MNAFFQGLDVDACPAPVAVVASAAPASVIPEVFKKVLRPTLRIAPPGWSGTSGSNPTGPIPALRTIHPRIRAAIPPFQGPGGSGGEFGEPGVEDLPDQGGVGL